VLDQQVFAEPVGRRPSGPHERTYTTYSPTTHAPKTGQGFWQEVCWTWKSEATDVVAAVLLPWNFLGRGSPGNSPASRVAVEQEMVSLSFS